MALGVEFSEEPADALWRCGILLQQDRGSNGQSFPDPPLRRGRDRAGATGTGRGAEWHRRMRPDRSLLLFRQGPDVQLRLHSTVRLELAPTAGLGTAGWRTRSLQRVHQGLQ